VSEDKLNREARSFLDEALAVEPGLGPDARQRMRAHLLRSVAGASVVATGVAATQTSLAAGVATTGSAALAASGAAPAAATAIGSATAAGTLTKAALGLVALGLAGGGATAAWQLRRPVPTEIARVSVAPPEVPQASDESVPPIPALPPDQATAPSRDDSLRPRREVHPPAKGAPAARSVPTPDSFPEELAMLERARVALAAGDWQRALGEIAETGRLASTRTFAEERDALRILALCAGGREAEARRLTTAFRSTFPRSLQMERIERACSKVVTDGEPGGHPR
jgi:hypothetical protein